MGTRTVKSLIVRLEPALYDAAASLAKKRRLSVNALIRESLAAVVKAEEGRELYEAFEFLGRYTDACNAEYAFPAQVEVIRKDVI